MKIINLNEELLSLGWIVGQYPPPKHAATFILKATFRLRVNEAPLNWEEEPDLLSGDLSYEDEPEGSLYYESDFVPFKPRADVLVLGTCHAPGGKPVSATRVRFKVGEKEKSLAVFGDRFWGEVLGLAGTMSDPVPFTEMELRYENSFGGEGYKKNLVGKGYGKKSSKIGAATRPLPNIEDPEHLVGRSSDQPGPAGFGPLGKMWEPRISRTGTYTGKWQKERWPWFPKDFDWSYFNAAPPDQQIEGYLRGDEDLEFENLQSQYPLYRSELPGFRARCFLDEAQEKGDTVFREVPLKLDTLWVDMNIEKLILVWRGVTEVRSIKLTDVERVFVFLESVSETSHDASHYLAMMHQRLREEEAEFDIPDENISAEDEAFEKEFADMEQEFVEMELEFSEIESTAEGAWAEQKAKMISSGVDPNLLEESGAAQSLQATKAGFLKTLIDLRQTNPEQAAELEEFTASFDEFEQMDKEMEAMEQEDLPITREFVEASAGKGDSLTGLDLSKLDLSGLDLSGIDLSQADLSKANLVRVNFAGSNLSDADLSGSDLTEADFSEAVMDDADLSDAVVTSAKFTHTSLVDAMLSHLDLQNADFSGCSGKGADFSSANLSDAKFIEASFERADFSGCNLTRADFSRAKLCASDFEGVIAREINMENADISELKSGEKADFTKGKFKNVIANGSIWESCILDQANFSQAVLTDSQFQEASLNSAILDRVEAANSNFEDASFQRSILTNSNLLRCSFERANLSDASLKGSNLYEAGFVDVIIKNTNVQFANLKQTLLA